MIRKNFKVSVNEKNNTIISVLIHKRKWNTLISVFYFMKQTIRSNKDHAELLQDLLISDDDDSKGGTVLHSLFRANPSIEIIKVITETFPELGSYVDKNGQYPLHLAAQCGASHKAIKMIYYLYPEAASLQDKEGKTPLHLACEHYKQNYGSIMFRRQTRAMAMDRGIEVMMNVAPGVINMEDNNGMTALEYAIMSNVEPMTIHNIQDASQMDWKKCKLTII